MRSKKTKLLLSRQTVRALSADSLDGVAGGTLVTYQCTQTCKGCLPSSGADGTYTQSDNGGAAGYYTPIKSQLLGSCMYTCK